jgi:RecA/RadA recombinase
MANLMSKFRSEYLKTSNIGCKGNIVSLPTGLDIIDLSNGAKDPQTGDLHLGMREGHFICFVGDTGTGKSTLAQQMAYGIVQPFENGMVNVLDLERAYQKPRMKNLYAKGDPELLKKFEEQVGDPLNIDVYLDDIRQMLADTATFKEAHKAELMETFIDANGKKVEVMAPTIFLIDSVAAMVSRDRAATVESGVNDNNMSHSQQAIENSQFVTKIMNIMFKYNIYVFFCGHITTKVNTNAADKRPSAFPWLAPEENLKGGRAVWYFADYMVRIHKGTMLHDPEKDYGIHGFINKIQVLKSRGNDSGISYPLVFELSRGYDNLLSNVQFLIDNKRILTGTRSYLDSMPDIKFTKKTVREVCKQHPELEQAISEEVLKIFEAHMPSIVSDGSQNAADAPDEDGVDPSEVPDTSKAAPENSKGVAAIKSRLKK